MPEENTRKRKEGYKALLKHYGKEFTQTADRKYLTGMRSVIGLMFEEGLLTEEEAEGEYSSVKVLDNFSRDVPPELVKAFCKVTLAMKAGKPKKYPE